MIEIRNIPSSSVSTTVENLHLQASRFTWHKQELFKGRDILYGSGWCGWGFESNIVASVANAAPTNVLQVAPIFEEGPSGMYTNSIPVSLQNQVLAYGIPALSAPAGRSELESRLVVVNQDMNDFKSNSWCRDHDQFGTRWLHSDIQNAGYFYTYRLFNAFVRDGVLL